jgi:hypothetical protein
MIILGNSSDFPNRFEPPIKFAQIQKQICFQDFYFKLCFEFELTSERNIVPYLSIGLQNFVNIGATERWFS